MDCAKYGYENIPSSWQYSQYITLNSSLLSDTDKYGLLSGLASSASKIIPANLSSIPKGRLVKWAYVIPCKKGMNFINDLVETRAVSVYETKYFIHVRKVTITFM